MRRIIVISAIGVVIGGLLISGMVISRSADRTILAIAAESESETFLVETLERDVRIYDSFGQHRSGEAGDLATTDWLEERLQSIGYSVSRLSFTVPTTAVRSSTLVIEDMIFETFPQFPVTPTPAGGVSGHVFSIDEAPQDWTNRIAFVEIEGNRRTSSLMQADYLAVINSAARSGASAVIVMIRSECGAYKELNAPIDLDPWPVPVVLLGDRDADAILLAISSGTSVQLFLESEAVDLEAFNLVAQIGPTDAPPIIVSTPQSGWFYNASERGSGIAVFLALAEWAAAQPDQHFMFVANSGHERSNLGAHHFMEEVAPEPDETAFWLHIGANVGASELDGLSTPANSRYLMVNLNNLPRSWALFRGQPGYGRPIPLELGLAQGELGAYHEAGYRPLAGVFGAGPYHHCLNDRPNTVSYTATRDAALSLAGTLQQVLQ